MLIVEVGVYRYITSANRLSSCALVRRDGWPATTVTRLPLAVDVAGYTVERRTLCQITTAADFRLMRSTMTWAFSTALFAGTPTDQFCRSEGHRRRPKRSRTLKREQPRSRRSPASSRRCWDGRGPCDRPRHRRKGTMRHAHSCSRRVLKPQPRDRNRRGQIGSSRRHQWAELRQPTSESPPARR